MWRPKEGWKNPHEVIYKPGINSAVDVAEGQAYEAGADAMYQPAYDKGKADLLEALKKKGLANEKGVRGYLVFIPEEE